MKALVINALGRGFDLEDVEIATPIEREALVDVQTAGLCHTDLLFATHDIVPMPAVQSRDCGNSGRSRPGRRATPSRRSRRRFSSAVVRSVHSMSIGPALPVYTPGVYAAPTRRRTAPEPQWDCLVPGFWAGAGRLRRTRSTTFRWYAGLYLQGRMNLDDLVSKKIWLRDVNDGYAASKDGALTRVVVASF